MFCSIRNSFLFRLDNFFRHFVFVFYAIRYYNSGWKTSSKASQPITFYQQKYESHNVVRSIPANYFTLEPLKDEYLKLLIGSEREN